MMADMDLVVAASIVAFVGGSVALLTLTLGAGGRGTRVALAVCIAILAVTYLGLWWDPEPTAPLHMHDFYHYYLGARFYPEVGHTRLYVCTLEGFSALAGQGVDVPLVELVRDLAQVSAPPLDGKSLAAAHACRDEYFSPQRWQAWLDTLRTLLAMEPRPATWATILLDFGNNSPPSWNVLGYPLANAVPARPFLLYVFPLLDQVLLLGVVPWLVARSFGREVLAAYLLVYLFNPLAGLGWTGGSFLRALWLTALVAGVCALATRRYARAGLALAASTALRIFPVFFALAALASLAIRGEHSALRRCVLGGAATGGALIVAATASFGSHAWADFVAILTMRVAEFSNNSIGFETIMRTWNVSDWPRFIGDAEALARMREWLQALAWDRVRAAWPERALVAGIGLLTLAAVPWREPARATVVAGSLAVFCLLTPFTYYYAFLALLPIAAHGLAPRVRALVYGVILLGVLALAGNAAALHLFAGGEVPSLYAVSSGASRRLLGMFLALLLVLVVAARPKGLRGAVAGCAVLLVAGAAIGLHGLRGPWQTEVASLRVLPPPVASPGVVVNWQPATDSWPGGGYLDITFTGPGQWLRLPLGDMARAGGTLGVMIADGPARGGVVLDAGAEPLRYTSGAAALRPRVLAVDAGARALESGLLLRPVPGTRGVARIGIAGVTPRVSAIED